MANSTTDDTVILAVYRSVNKYTIRKLKSEIDEIIAGFENNSKITQAMIEPLDEKLNFLKFALRSIEEDDQGRR